MNFFLVRVVTGHAGRRLSARAALIAVLALVCCLLIPTAGAWAAAPGGGTQRWSATYDAGSPAFSYAVAVSPDGSTVYSTGTTNYGTTAPGHYATVAVDAVTGQEKWAHVYRSNSNPGQRDGATRIAVSPDGSKVFVTGEGECPVGCGGGGFTGYTTIAYDASTGAMLWSSPYSESGPGAYSIAVSPDGSKVFVNGGSGNFGAATVAYDASTGAQLYVIQNADSLVPWKALAVSPDSSTVYVATADGGQCESRGVRRLRRNAAMVGPLFGLRRRRQSGDRTEPGRIDALCGLIRQQRVCHGCLRRVHRGAALGDGDQPAARRWRYRPVCGGQPGRDQGLRSRLRRLHLVLHRSAARHRRL